MKVLAYSYEFQEMFLSKDIFLIPYYISKALCGSLEYVYCANKGNTYIPKEYRESKITESSTKNDFVAMMKYIVLKSKCFDVLFINGSSFKHMIIVRLYKLFNHCGKVVVFGDMEYPQAREFRETDFVCPIGIKGYVKRRFTDFFMNNSTYLVANVEAYNEMKILCEKHQWRGLLHFYPCLDDERLNEYGMKCNTWEEKENIMVCVGRIGNYQKNTEMLLEALKVVDLKDWKIYMIGPITSSFDLKEGGEYQKVINRFFEDYPMHKDKVIFTGMIYDQRRVFEFYNRAKVLLMTSRHESWGNVYSEAAALGCYILSTEVGGAKLCSNNWLFGYKIEQDNHSQLASVMQNLIDGEIKMDPNKCKSLLSLCYNTQIRKRLLTKV